jgi:hypothetical protein
MIDAHVVQQAGADTLTHCNPRVSWGVSCCLQHPLHCSCRTPPDQMSAHLQYIADEKRQVCDICGHLFKPKGFDSHQRACERRATELEDDEEQWASIPPVRGQWIQ